MKKRLSPRKDGEQSRSKDMVSHITEAATRILEKVGYDKTTTNKIAEKAGISIGSFYQYFPNKDSLFAKIVENLLTIKTQEFAILLKINSKASTETLIDIMLTNLLESFHQNKKIAKFLSLQLNYLDKSDLQLKMRDQFSVLLSKELFERKIVSDHELALLKSEIIINSVMGVIYPTIHKENFSSKKNELKKELRILIMSYLLSNE